MYEIKIKRGVMQQDGTEKKVTEAYLVDNALLFAEAEQMGLEIPGCEDVIAIKRINIMEVCNTPDPTKDEKIYLAEVETTTIGDDLKEKKISYKVLIWSTTLENAQSSMVAYLKQGYDDMRLVSIKETKYIDIITHA